jgi:hypothetical protein
MGMSRKVRRTRVYKVSKTARAIKSVLATSSFMLALAGSGEAFAQTCTTVSNPVTSCTGTWTNDTIEQSDFPDPDPGETVRIGTAVLTSVTNSNMDGVYTDWDLNQTVVLGGFGSISVDGGDGIHMNAYNGAGVISMSGGILTTVTTAGNNAIDAYAVDDLTISISNNGGATATAAGTSTYDIVSVLGISNSGDVTVNNNENNNYGFGVAAYAYTGNAIAVAIQANDAYGHANVYGTGDFVATVSGDGFGDGGYATAIEAHGGKYSTVNVSGLVYAYAYYGSATGIYATGGNVFGSASATSAGTMGVLSNDGGLGGTATGIKVAGPFAYGSNTGDMYINVDPNAVFDPTTTYNAIGISVSAGIVGDANNSGYMTVYGYGGYAIGLQVNASDAGATNSGDIYVTSFNGYAYGIQVTGTNVATVDMSGPGVVKAESLNGGDAFGVWATTSAPGSSTTLNNNGALIAAYSNVAGDATAAYVHSYGDVYVTGDGNFAATANDTGNATGIDASSSFGDVSIDIDLGSHINVNAFNGGDAVGIDAYANAGSVSVTSNAEVSAFSGFGYAIGIVASGFTGVSVTSNDYLYAHGELGAEGIIASAAADGNVVVNTSVDGNMDVASTASYAFGIDASASGTGTIGMTLDGEIYVSASGASGTGNATGVYAGSDDGNITITTGGDFEALVYSDFDYGFGIHAYTAGDGDISITTAGAGDIHVEAYHIAYGIVGFAADNGDVKVDNSQYIYAGAQYRSYGIYTHAADGNTDIDNSGSLEIYSDAEFANGIYAYTTGAGNIDIDNTVDGTMHVYSYAGGAYGIWANGTDGYVSITNDGYINVQVNQLGGAANSPYDAGAITAQTGTGTVDITNSADLRAYTYGDNAIAWGISGYSGTGATVDVTTTGGKISALTFGSTGANAYGIHAFGGNAGSGDITVDAQAGTNIYAITQGATSSAYGILVESYGSGDASATNGGYIRAETHGDGSAAVAVLAEANGTGDVTINMTGEAYAYTYGANSNAYGLDAIGNTGNVTVDTETGSWIEVHTYGATSYATGIYAGTGGTGAVKVYSDGGIDVSTVTDGSNAFGINATSADGNILVDTYNNIMYVDTQGNNLFSAGMYVHSSGTGDIDVENDTEINVESNGSSVATNGIYAVAFGAGDVTVNSINGIYVTSHGAFSTAYGIDADAQGGGNVHVTNDDNIEVYTYGYQGDAWAIQASAVGTGTVIVDGSGNVTTYTDGTYADAFGVETDTVDGLNTVDMDAYIHVDTSGFQAYAYGIDAHPTPTISSSTPPATTRSPSASMPARRAAATWTSTTACTSTSARWATTRLRPASTRRRTSATRPSTALPSPSTPRATMPSHSASTRPPPPARWVCTPPT